MPKKNGILFSKEILDQEILSIRNGDTVLLEIEPVYGSLVILQAKNILLTS